VGTFPSFSPIPIPSVIATAVIAAWISSSIRISLDSPIFNANSSSCINIGYQGVI